VKKFPISKSGRRKIERAIRAGWQPGMSIADALKKTRRNRRNRTEAGNREF
jgi:hypothetical protein